MNTYDVGDTVRLQAVFTNSAGTQVDPSSVTLQYKQYRVDASSYTTLVYGVNSITLAAAGSYYHDLNISSGGEWRYRWNGLGANAAAVEGTFQVRWRNVG